MYLIDTTSTKFAKPTISLSEIKIADLFWRAEEMISEVKSHILVPSPKNKLLNVLITDDQIIGFANLLAISIAT